METAKEAVGRALAQSRESMRQRSTSSTVRAGLVWRSMTELYGAAFLAAYGEQPSPLWLSAIEGLTDDECRAGFTRLARQAREYPCNLTQFVAACRYRGTQSTLGVPTTPDELRRALPPPERRATPERVDSWLKQIRVRLA